MDVMISSIAVIAATGCFLAIMASDIRDRMKDKQPVKTSPSENPVARRTNQ